MVTNQVLLRSAPAKGANLSLCDRDWNQVGVLSPKEKTHEEVDLRARIVESGKYEVEPLTLLGQLVLSVLVTGAS